MKDLLLAIGFMTILPQPAGWLNKQPDHRMTGWFSLAGFFIGGLTAFFFWLIRPWMPLQPSMALALLFQYLITGGLHLDGLADSSDALLSFQSRQKKLEIMKDSRIGSHGAAVMILAILIKWSSLVHLPEPMHLGLLILIPAIGRAAITAGAWQASYPRFVGTGSGVIGQIETRQLMCCWAPLFAVAFFWIKGLALIPVAFVSALILKKIISRQLGGMTGDTLGMMNELVEIGCLVTTFMILTYWS